MNGDKIQISLKPYQGYELEEMNEQLRRELNALNSNIYKITRATSVNDLFDLTINSISLLSKICRDRQYIMSLESEKKQKGE